MLLFDAFGILILAYTRPLGSSYSCTFCVVQLAGVFLLVIVGTPGLLRLVVAPTAPPSRRLSVRLIGGAPVGEEPLDIGAVSVMCHVLGTLVSLVFFCVDG